MRYTFILGVNLLEQDEAATEKLSSKCVCYGKINFLKSTLQV